MVKKNVGFLLYQCAITSGASNGVKSQALTWKLLLEAKGVDVTLLNSWDNYIWDDFHAIHIFGYDEAIATLVRSISHKNTSIFLSPIIDSNKRYIIYGLATILKIRKLRLFTLNSALRSVLPLLKGVCVRSNHEYGYFQYSFQLDKDKIFHIPLSYSVDFPHDRVNYNKDNFCLHISSIYQDRKNVLRLIEAAIKFNFRLVLAGSTGSSDEFEPIRTAAIGHSNIEILGFVSEGQKIDLYQKAKVFALPSLLEGVGIVALDAAYFGCNIVITKLGGPKDYFPSHENVRLVNPYSIDDIGQSILCMLSKINTPIVSNFLRTEFSSEVLTANLLNMYGFKK